jgi:hypothetical protein
MNRNEVKEYIVEQKITNSSKDKIKFWLEIYHGHEP